MTKAFDPGSKLLVLSFSIALAVFLPAWAEAQIILQGGSFQTSTTASTTASGGFTCSDSGGAVGTPDATASCADVDGNTAAASAHAIVSVDEQGADFSLTADGAGAVVVGAPGPFAAQANGSGLANAVRNWFMSNDTLYSMAVVTNAEFEGGAAANSTVSFSGGTAASGLLASGNYALSANVSAAAGGVETGLLTGAASASASVRLAFAAAGSPTLIHGTVLAAGIGRPGLLVEALDGSTPIASALTGDDGSYLLPVVTTPAMLRISDPAGGFTATESPVLAPPASFDADLAPAASLPALDRSMLGVLALVMAVVGWAHRGRLARQSDQARASRMFQ